MGETDRNPSTGEGTKREEKKKGWKRVKKKSQASSRIRPVGLAFYPINCYANACAIRTIQNRLAAFPALVSPFRLGAESEMIMASSQLISYQNSYTINFPNRIP